MLSLSTAVHVPAFLQDTARKGGWALLMQYLGLPTYKEIYLLLPKHLGHRPLSTSSSLGRI